MDPLAIGGSLSVSTYNFTLVNNALLTETLNPSAIALVVTQQQPGTPAPFFPVGYQQNTAIATPGMIAVSSFLKGGFSSITLGAVDTVGTNQDNVEFSGPVSITATNTLKVSTGGFHLCELGSKP